MTTALPRSRRSRTAKLCRKRLCIEGRNSRDIDDRGFACRVRHALAHTRFEAAHEGVRSRRQDEADAIETAARQVGRGKVAFVAKLEHRFGNTRLRGLADAVAVVQHPVNGQRSTVNGQRSTVNGRQADTCLARHVMYRWSVHRICLHEFSDVR
nr:hypothetical protein [Roseivivax halotolerans]